jgi:hypothetical protein
MRSIHVSQVDDCSFATETKSLKCEEIEGGGIKQGKRQIEWERALRMAKDL